MISDFFRRSGSGRFARVLRRRLRQASRGLSPGRLTSLGLMVGCVGFAAFVAWTSLQARDRALEAAKASVQNLALVLEKQTARTVDAVDMLLRAALHDGGQRVAGRNPQARLLGLVEALSQDLTHIRGVKVIEADRGHLVQFAGYVSDASDLIDADALQSLRAGHEGGLHVGRPFYDSARNAWMLGISRRGAAGSPAEAFLAVAYVDLAHIQAVYKELDVGKLGSISLWHLNRMLLVRKPYDQERVGRSYPAAALFQNLAVSPAGVYDTSSATDSVKRVLAYRQLGNAPLVVVAALAIDEILAVWWRDVVLDLALVPLVFLILLAFVALVARESKRRERAEARVREKSELLETTLEKMDQGLMMFDHEGVVQVCNRRARELLGLPARMMAARPLVRDVIQYQHERGEFDNVDPEAAARITSLTVEGQPTAYERERPDGTVLEIRTSPFGDGGAVRTYTDITDRKKSEERIAHLARHDAVTALPNRVLFRERLEQALANRRRHGGSVALLCLDLDQFKAVNDTLGHPVGDALLKLVADRIKGDLRDEDTVARLGGDEFAILQIGGAQPRDSAALARRLIDSVNRPYRIGEDSIDVSVSIGIAVVAEDACDPDQLFKHADLALYRAKADGRGTFRFFEARMDAEVRARRQLEKDLRESLTRGDFELHYQSLHGAADQEAVGFEALLRWRHPTRGLVQPGYFISVAEETRLIVPLGEWVLRQACHDAAKWPGHLRLAINVSAAQFRATSLVQAVMSALAASGLAANRLEIEITETILMQGNEALRTLHQLRELGVRMIMDDFGTGYSSLSYLHSFPFDRMKIDRSFVRHMIEKPDSAAIVRAIVQLGASLGISTIAEGVETLEQFQALRQMGCGEVQGYLFSRPEPIADALKRLPPRLAVAAA